MLIAWDSGYSAVKSWWAFFVGFIEGRKQVFIMYAQRLGAVIYNERATGIGAGIKRYESF